jgi:hypothetical protein
MISKVSKDRLERNTTLNMLVDDLDEVGRGGVLGDGNDHRGLDRGLSKRTIARIGETEILCIAELTGGLLSKGVDEISQSGILSSLLRHAEDTKISNDLLNSEKAINVLIDLLEVGTHGHGVELDERVDEGRIHQDVLDSQGLSREVLRALNEGAELVISEGISLLGLEVVKVGVELLLGAEVLRETVSRKLRSNKGLRDRAGVLAEDLEDVREREGAAVEVVKESLHATDQTDLEGDLLRLTLNSILSLGRGEELSTLSHDGGERGSLGGARVLGADGLDVLEEGAVVEHDLVLGLNLDTELAKKHTELILDQVDGDGTKRSLEVKHGNETSSHRIIAREDIKSSTTLLVELLPNEEHDLLQLSNALRGDNKLIILLAGRFLLFSTHHRGRRRDILNSIGVIHIKGLLGKLSGILSNKIGGFHVY